MSWRINKKISLPLMFVDLDTAGNSNTPERFALGADREFVGKQWFEMLNKNKVPYFIRVKENTLLPWGKNNPIQLKKLFQHLKWGANRLVLKEIHGYSVYFAGIPQQNWRTYYCYEQSGSKSQRNPR